MVSHSGSRPPKIRSGLGATSRGPDSHFRPDAASTASARRRGSVAHGERCPHDAPRSDSRAERQVKEAIELDRSGWRVKKPSDPVTLTPLKPEEPAANLSAAVKTLKLDSGVPAADPSRPALEHCYSGEPEEEGIVVYVETNIVGFKHKEAQLNCSV